eukprot:gene8455-280_t
MHVILPWRSEISYYELSLKRKKFDGIVGYMEEPYQSDPFIYGRRYLCNGYIPYDDMFIRYEEMRECSYLKVYASCSNLALFYDRPNDLTRWSFFCDKNDFIKWMKEFKYNGFLEKVKECIELRNTMIKLT